MTEIRTKTLVIFLGISLFYSGTLALADYRADDTGGVRNRDTRVVDVRRDGRGTHYYRNGRWYRHGWFGFGIAVPVLSTGVIVSSLPPAYSPVVIQGTTYYYGDNTYFRPAPAGGYVVVTQPSN